MGSEPGCEAGSEAALDAGSDAGLEAGLVAGFEAGLDAGDELARNSKAAPGFDVGLLAAGREVAGSPDDSIAVSSRQAAAKRAAECICVNGRRCM